MGDPLDLRTERAIAEHPELDAELRLMRAEFARLLGEPPLPEAAPPLISVLQLSAFGREPRIAALHDFAAQRRLIRLMRDALGLLRDEPSARSVAAWLRRAGDRHELR
jgi:hypothetical protein